MTLVDVIMSGDEVRVREYTATRSFEELRRELPTKKKEKDELSLSIRDHELGYVLFTTVTEIEALEEITTQGVNGKPGSANLGLLAGLLKGEVVTGNSRIRNFLLDFAKTNGMPRLTGKHQAYVDNFTLAYVASRTPEQLEEELTFKSASFDPDSRLHNFFYCAVSARIREQPGLAYEVMRKVTGWVALEEITTKGIDGKPGIEDSFGLAGILKGEKVVTSARNFFLNLATANGMPRLTGKHQAYVDNFTLAYVASRTPEQLEEELNFARTLSFDPNAMNYNHFQHALSERIREQPGLAYEVMRKVTGWTALEEITATGIGNKPGIQNSAGLITLLKGEKARGASAKRFLLDLATANGMPKLTAKHQAYVDNFTLAYVASRTPEQLEEEIYFGMASFDPKASTYSYLQHALSERIREQPGLAYEVMRKVTGWTSLEEITRRGVDGKSGTDRLKGLVGFLRGGRSNTTSARKFFRELFVEGTLQSHEFQVYCAQHGIDLTDLDAAEPDQKEYLTRLLGKDFFEASKPVRRAAPSGERRRVTEWSDRDTAELANFAEKYRNEEGILEALNANRDDLQEQYGRSLWAITRKLERMGLLPAMRFGAVSGGVREITYPLPAIHEHYEANINVRALFANNADTIDRGIIPLVLPVLAYHDVVKDDSGNTQLIHVSVPMWHNGSDLEGYHEFEYEVLTTIQGYISDPTSFERKTDPRPHLRGEPVEGAHILRIRDEERSEDRNRDYVQLLQRARFSRDIEKLETASIRLSSGSEIYFFLHNPQNVTYANTTPAQI